MNGMVSILLVGRRCHSSLSKSVDLAIASKKMLEYHKRGETERALQYFEVFGKNNPVDSFLYQIAIRSALYLKNIPKAEDLINRAKEEGKLLNASAKVNEKFFEAVIGGLWRNDDKSLNLQLDIYHSLPQLGVRQTFGMQKTILLCLKEMNIYKKAIEMLEHLEETKQVNIEHYKIILKMTAKGNIQKLLDRMKQHSISPDLQMLNILIHKQDLTDGMELFAKLKVRDRVTYNSLLRKCLKNPTTGLELYNSMLKEGIEPDKYTLKSLAEMGAEQEVLKLFVSSQSIRESMNVVMYNHVLKCLNSHSIVEKIYKTMQESNVTPNEVTYNLLIRATSRVSGSDYHPKCAQLFEEMLTKGIQPNIHTYQALISNYQYYSLHESMKLYEDMKNRNIKPTTVLINTLIEACKRQNQVQLMQKLEKDLQALTSTLTTNKNTANTATPLNIDSKYTKKE